MKLVGRGFKKYFGKLGEISSASVDAGTAAFCFWNFRLRRLQAMLISHRHRFIYLKTMKTASTSVEVFFESECFPVGGYRGPQHATEQVVTEAGIVGARKADTTDSEWFHHMPAAAVREKIGHEIWAKYLKFCVIRNPFDKVVSWWWHQRHIVQPSAKWPLDDRDIRRTFNDWVLRTTDMMMDRDKYVMDGALCVDQLLRYENLSSDLKNLCQRLGLSKPISALGQYKSELRNSSMPFSSYYEPAAAAKVATWFDWELKHFGYSLHSD